jgi:RNA polymerase sigma-70 factor (ECF subfamily)
VRFSEIRRLTNPVSHQIDHARHGGIETNPALVYPEVPLRGFEETVLPHLHAAFNYARWLTKSDADAEDVVQDACVRAIRYFPSLRDDDARPWLFAIVRNTWYSRLLRRTNLKEVHAMDGVKEERTDDALDPEERLLQRHTIALVRAALEQLPVDFREVIVMREIEGLSYKEIAEVVRVPIGTVMSRLARARERLAAVLKLTTSAENLR